MKREFKHFKITYSLIALCIFVYLISFVLYGPTMDVYEAYTFGGFFPASIQYNHEYWRFITANFIHFGLFHLIMNCYSMKNVGQVVELSFTPKEYIVILFTCMVTTNLFPYIMARVFQVGVNTISGGISGVIFGMLGCICVLAYFYKGVYHSIYQQLLPSIVLMFVISVSVPSISLFGHLGGFVGGVISTYVIVKMRRKKHTVLYN